MAKQYLWDIPAGRTYDLYRDMLQQPHLLIAGATGSGKSVIINGIIYTALYKAPGGAADNVSFILIDPKRVELVDYAGLPHTIRYACEPAAMMQALREALSLTEIRYQEMQQQRVKKYQGGHIYVIIDELADLMTTARKQVEPLTQRLCQIGRAANVHVIAATQCPLASVIPTPIKVNFDARVGLRTRSKQDSRNILEFTGCELLPRYGQGYYMRPEGVELYSIPMHTDADIRLLVNHWRTTKPKRVWPWSKI